MEDNLPDALLVREAIRQEQLPFEMHLAADGQEAIEFIARAETDLEALRPEFVLVDLNLPKADGFEVLQRLRASEKFGTSPVLVVTSSDAPNDRKRAEELGAAYFRKLPSYDEFLKVGAAVRTLMLQKGLV